MSRGKHGCHAVSSTGQRAHNGLHCIRNAISRVGQWYSSAARVNRLTVELCNLQQRACIKYVQLAARAHNNGLKTPRT